MQRFPWMRCSIVAFVAIVLPFFAAQGSAQEYSHDGAVTATFYNCPEGMTADTLVTADCSAVSEGFEASLSWGEGQGVQWSLGEATFDGTSFTWSGLPISSTPMGFGVTESKLPAGYVDNVVTNDGVTFKAHSSGGVPLSIDLPAGAVDFYNFTTMPAAGQADLTIIARACPTGYAGDDYIRACNGRRANITFEVGDLESVTTDIDGIARLTIVPGDIVVSPELSAGIDRVVYAVRRSNGTLVASEPLENGVLLLGPEDENGIHHRDNIFIDAYFVPAPEGPAELDVSLYAISCPRDPGNTSPTSTAFPPEDCESNPGVWMWVTTPDGSFVGSCVTDATGVCVVSAPSGATIVVTEDEETIPAGYAPRENPIITEAYTEFAHAVFVNLPVSPEQPTDVATHGTVVEPTEAPIPTKARPAHIHSGTCGALTRTASIDLSDLTPGEGTPEGAPGASIAESSFSIIDISLDDLLASPYAINVHASVDNMRAYLVCGDIGGVREADGSLTIGLREMRGSGFEGIAYLVPDPIDPSMTDVWVFVAPELAEEDRATPEPTAGTPVPTPQGG